METRAEDAASPDAARRVGQTQSRPWRWVARRVALGLGVIVAASVLVFLATQALPGDPAQAILGKEATPESVTALRESLNLNRPMYAQYFSWLGAIVTGDFGESLSSRVSVTSLLGPALSNSLSLLFVSALIAVPASIALGVVTAVRRDKALDRTSFVGSLLLTAMPEFVIAMLLVVLLSTTLLHLLPAVAVIPPGSSPLLHPLELALPVLTLILAVVPYLYRLVRSTMIDVLDSEFVAMARLKGVPEKQVIWRHAIPNALIPVTQASAVVFAYLLGGIVVVEFVFGFPGIGTLLTDAVTQRDIPVIQAVTLVIAAGVVIFNLLADLITVLLTPRLRTGRGFS